MGRRNPLTDWAQFFLSERYPWCNQACQIWSRSLKRLRGSRGSNFSISHWLCWSSLQHSHTTVWACDCNHMPGAARRRAAVASPRRRRWRLPSAAESSWPKTPRTPPCRYLNTHPLPISQSYFTKFVRRHKIITSEALNRSIHQSEVSERPNKSDTAVTRTNIVNVM